MPLTDFQSKVALLLAKNRSIDSHLAGGAALHFEPESIRFSIDLDYFHDSEIRVSSAFNADRDLLVSQGFECKIEMNQPGYVRCLIKNKEGSTKIEWAHDSDWRFMPVQMDPRAGYILHPIDITINKLLALVGRDESRDFLDVNYTNHNLLPLGAQCWAACGKDPGFNPRSLLEMLKRRGKYRSEDFSRLNLNKKIDLQNLKTEWLIMLEQAELFIKNAPGEDIGCLYYNKKTNKFIEPTDFSDANILKHFGRAGGIIPMISSK